ncbi:ABC transporter permease [Aeromicrobium sp. CTD01-1L150]|uniref:ABC transporter permease n=1 Tax=Aeromicrobium sp. CTD01-1L150 TaxID=3341830 RepID=UPI0035C01C1F
MTSTLTPAWLHGRRILTGWTRTPAVLANAFVMPVLMLLIVLLIFGRAIETISPDPPITRLVPLMVCSGVMFAALSTATALVTERDDGLLDRFATLPNPPLAPLLGRVGAEVVRSCLSAVLVLIVGTVLGFRAAPWAYLVIVALAALLALGIGCMTTWIGLRAKSPEAVIALAPLMMLLMFFNSGFVPREGFPGPVQPLVRLNPLTAYTETMASSGSAVGHLVAAGVWAVLLTTVGTLLLARARRF